MMVPLTNSGRMDYNRLDIRFIPPALVLNFSIDGSDYGSAIASTENDETFIKNGVCAALYE